MLGCWSSFLCFLGNLKSSITLPYFLCAQLTDEKVLGNHANAERREVVSNKSYTGGGIHSLVFFLTNGNKLKINKT